MFFPSNGQTSRLLKNFQHLSINIKLFWWKQINRSCFWIYFFALFNDFFGYLFGLDARYIHWKECRLKHWPVCAKRLLKHCFSAFWTIVIFFIQKVLPCLCFRNKNLSFAFVSKTLKWWHGKPMTHFHYGNTS